MTIIDKINNLTNDDLISLVKEINHIGNVDKPRFEEKSSLLTSLFKEYDEEIYYWYGIYSNVRILLESEVIRRICKDTFKC